MNIICLSTQNWDDRMWTNKQHIMYRLSKNHRVIYVDKGVLGLKNFFIKREDEEGFKFTIKNLFSLFEERNKNLTVLTEKFNFPNPYAFKIKLLKKYIKKNNLKDIILWIYQPEYEKYIGELGEKLVVYDCVDEYSTFPAYNKPGKKDGIIETEKSLLKKADLVITSAPGLYESKKEFNKNTHLVHNVGNAKHFMKALDPNTEIPSDIGSIKKPIIGFIGALDKYKVDFELLQHIAEKHPEWSVVLIGPKGKVDFSTRTSSLKKFGNIHMLGTKDYNPLPNYVKAFDVCMIPYNINDYTKNCFPIKFFEFLASGKPVVTTNLPALKEFEGSVKYASGKEDFTRAIEESLEHDPNEMKQKRIEAAKQNSWESRISKIIGLIEKSIKGKHGKI